MTGVGGLAELHTLVVVSSTAVRQCTNSLSWKLIYVKKIKACILPAGFVARFRNQCVGKRAGSVGGASLNFIDF